MHPKSVFQLSSKARADKGHVGGYVTNSGPASSSKTWLQSPSVLGRAKKGEASATGGAPKATPVTLGFMSPPMRASGNSKSKLSTLGLTPPLGRVPIDSNSNTSSVASVSVPVSAATYDAAAQSSGWTLQQQYQQQPFSFGHSSMQGTAVEVSHQGRAIAQLPSFAAAFGSLVSPPARAVSFSSAPKQGIPMQPWGHGSFMQPLGQGSFAQTAAQGLNNMVHHTMQPYAQTSMRFQAAESSMPQRVAATAQGLHTAHNGFVLPSSVTKHAPTVSTLDILLGTDKLRNIARSDLHLPIGAVQMPGTNAAFLTTHPSFFDSVTAFADGFALPGPREQPFGWGRVTYGDAHDGSAVVSTCAMDAVEFCDTDAAAINLHELSEDGTLSYFDSDQMACDSVM